ncbi:DNA-binding protein [Roseateles sp.]|uniref:DNA-binding protein n=1 Tax=Roseateles sp. TaxID=1971397 RepID=UPI0025D44205|nr:DNA-binding protein [Roseateles sp.]MBV8037463.1 DNA-binding protein [Roseateles sp.]
MTLQNLLRIGRLKQHAATADEVQRLLAAIDRNLADAAVSTISDETRFDAAYKAVMQCALVGMLAAGFRPSSTEPGHHQTMIQSLPLTLGAENDVWVVLDALRRQRNANDYTGQPITPAASAECIAQAKALRKRLRKHLETVHPDLLKTPQ